jgi:hypothetical protein
VSDEKLRKLEREAANDPEALEQLRRERCRVGQCCACDDRVPSIPGPPPEAYGSAIIIEATHIQEPIAEGADRLGILLHGWQAEANMQIRIVGPGAMPALEWLRSVFKIDEPSTGIMDARTLGARLLPSQEKLQRPGRINT